MGMPTAATLDPAGACQDVDGARGAAFTVTTHASCTPYGSASVPPVMSREVVLCNDHSTAGGGCGAGLACSPRVSSSLRACVAAAGAQACPQGYPDRHLLSAVTTDTRACQCQCATTGACTQAQVNVYAAAACSGTPVTIVADGVCHPFGLTGLSANVASGASPSGVSCTVSGAISGSITMSGQTTVCCQ
jgi:hypothetical protein